MRSSLKILAILLAAALAASCSAFQAATTPSALQRVQQRNNYYAPSFWMSEESSAAAAEEPTEEAKEVDPKVVCPNCDLCDGSGRIAGGIGAVLPWIPIKAYRPCPNFVERGGTYQRAGQGLDEIAFGKKNK